MVERYSRLKIVSTNQLSEFIEERLCVLRGDIQRALQLCVGVALVGFEVYANSMPCQCQQDAPKTAAPARSGAFFGFKKSGREGKCCALGEIVVFAALDCAHGVVNVNEIPADLVVEVPNIMWGVV